MAVFTTVRNKLVFVAGKLFRLSLMFVGKARRPEKNPETNDTRRNGQLPKSQLDHEMIKSIQVDF